MCQTKKTNEKKKPQNKTGGDDKMMSFLIFCSLHLPMSCFQEKRQTDLYSLQNNLKNKLISREIFELNLSFGSEGISSIKFMTGK